MTAVLGGTPPSTRRSLAFARLGGSILRMRAPLSLLAWLGAAFLALGPRGAAAGGPDLCIKFRGEVRYGALGYNHLVHITNTCAVAADCSVTTDVNPEAQAAEVGARSEVVVTTFLGSPARTFTPSVKCTMRR